MKVSQGDGSFRTVGQLRKLLETLPDDTVLYIAWDDDEAGIREDSGILIYEDPGFDMPDFHCRGSLTFVPERQAHIGDGNLLYAGDWN